MRTLCRTLRVSASGYYASRSRSPSARAQRQSSLAIRIREVHMASRQTYGAPRVHAELSAQGIACCRNTVAKLMRREQIVPRAIRHFRVTTDSRNTKKVSTNLVKRRFKAKRPNSCWLSDVTYIPTREGLLYLAAVMDIYSRAIVGWGMSHSLGGKLAADALEMAIHQRGVPDIVHSDRGSTYATSIYRAHSSTPDPPEHEPQRGLLGQRTYGELLPLFEDRVGHARRLQDDGRSASKSLRIY